VKTNPTKGRPWLEALKSLEVEAKKDETGRTNTALSPADEISESLVQRGAKSDKSLLPVSDTEENSGVVVEEAKARQVRRTLVTTQDQLAGVVADLEGTDLVALDLVLQRHFALLGSAASVLGTLQRGLIIFATY
jgi:hypothetical protein